MQKKLFFQKSEFLSALLVFLSLFPFASFAASELFPVKEILVQLFNFSVFFAAFVFLVRKPIKVFFHKRQEQFFSFEKQAVQWEKEKQKELKVWQKKLELLKEQEAGIQGKAEKEGQKIISLKKEELKNLKSRLQKETDFFLQLERDKSKRDILLKWKDKVIQSADLELKKQALSPDFQKERLKDFFKHIEARL